MKPFLSLLIPSFLFILFQSSCISGQASAQFDIKPSLPEQEIVLSSAVKWGPLNPARGNKSPQAGQLWGDRKRSGPSGFLVKFADGFSSPPHIHNVTYRGVVISGLVHNDDPKAKNLWLPAGSFWTQPAGDTHITAAKGDHNIAYIETDRGPYLVKPPVEAFNSRERPVTIEASNLVWLNASDVTWVKQEHGVQIAFLWRKKKDPRLSGSFIKLPAGFTGNIKGNGSDFRAIVIKGSLKYKGFSLDAGSYFGATAPQKHPLISEQETILYVRTNGQYQIDES